MRSIHRIKICPEVLTHWFDDHPKLRTLVYLDVLMLLRDAIIHDEFKNGAYFLLIGRDKNTYSDYSTKGLIDYIAMRIKELGYILEKDSQSPKYRLRSYV